MSGETIVHRGRSAFTLIEIVIAMAVIAVALAGALGTITTSARLSRTDEETVIASQAARTMIEGLQAAPFRDTFKLYNAEPSDDPGGLGTGPGPDFDVAGFDPLLTDADGRVGRILFPVPAAAPGVLRENLVEASFGMPRDLNADGPIDNLDHVDDYLLLPVRVRIEWLGADGPRSFELDTILSLR
jgi:prepilin-type N-terminal cleavage/methylation domain-containing protein